MLGAIGTNELSVGNMSCGIDENVVGTVVANETACGSNDDVEVESSSRAASSSLMTSLWVVAVAFLTLVA